MYLSPLGRELLGELALVEHQGVQLVEGRTPEVEAALEELRAAGLVSGTGVLQVTGRPAPAAPIPERHLVKISATRAVLHRIVFDASHCGSPLREGTWVEPEAMEGAVRCRKCFPPAMPGSPG